MSNKLKGNTQKNNTRNRKQVIGYIIDFVMIVDFLILAFSGFFISNRFVTIRTGSSWWMIHYITAILFVLLIVTHGSLRACSQVLGDEGIEVVTYYDYHYDSYHFRSCMYLCNSCHSYARRDYEDVYFR
ncbi:MAG: DUF4405 domain-containing protein [Lachnospiraceae bacterium]|nr:DUF4405 domain-containing protein [Lachnospiraceae bacterium]